MKWNFQRPGKIHGLHCNYYPKQLKGLQKISLAPNEKKTVSFEISVEMLSFYDINMEFKPEKGKFTLWIGGSSLTENSADFDLI